MIKFKGKEMCLAEWADRIGISQDTLRHRFHAGWSVADMLTKPLSKRGRKA